MFRKQSDTQNIPVILINSSANKKNTKNAIDAGADDHISSPVQIEEVISRVNTQLELRALRNELKDCRTELDDLANSEQQFRFLTEDSPDFAARYDVKCRKTYMSPRLEEELGVRANELIGFTPIEVIPDDPQMVEYQARIQQVLDTGQAHDFEYCLSDSNHDIRYHNIRFVPEHNENGSIVGVLAIGRDVTELRATERQNALLRAMADNCADVMIFAHTLNADEGLPLQYYNSCTAHHLGYSSDEMSGLCVSDFTKYSSGELAIHMDALRKEKSLRIEAEHIRKDGKLVPVEVLLNYLSHAGEELAVGYCLDISKRKQAEQRVLENEQALRSSERKFRTLAENTPDNIVRYDRNCRTIYANPQVERLMYPSFGSMLGKMPTEFAPGSGEIKRYQEALQRVIETGRPASVEVEIGFTDKAPQVHQVLIVAERRANGRVHGALGIGRDITALKETERGLVNSRAELLALTQRREAAQKEERKRIARELHDDLGQYLTALNLQVSALQIGFAKKDEVLSGIVEHIVSLIDGMKKSLRNISQRLRPEALNMGLSVALECLANDILTQCNIDYSVKLHSDADEISEAGAVIAYRVTQESLTNIVRYAEANHVLISLERNANNFVLKVEDNGKGFDTSLVKPRSFGIVGMSERLQAIGGQIEIESELEIGTTVTALIPNLNENTV
jgi:PAS domain S-box-containing protein